MRPRASIIATMLAAAALGMAGCGTDADQASAPSAAPASALTAAERDAVLYLRDEERLARDLYAELLSTSGDQRFARIGASEQQHFDAMGTLIERYGLDDPAEGRAPGEFSSPELQALYDRLLKAGVASPEAAIAQGVIVEETDIADIDRHLRNIDEPEIEQVLVRLRAGSERHLAAFSRG